MTPETTCPLLWDHDAARFRPITDVLPDLAEWRESPERRHPQRTTLGAGLG